MLFNSIDFLFIFLPIVFCVYYLLIKFKLPKFSNLWLAISSLYFYAYYKIEFFPIIISSIFFNYIMGYFIEKNEKIKKPLYILCITWNLLLLCYYKYFNFLMETLNNLNLTHFDTMKLLLPLGISFFTFQQISYITDIYKKEAKTTNIIDYALFVSFFPQLIAGPICTFKELVPQFQDYSKKILNKTNVNLGIFYITIGLFKKVMLADGFISFIQKVIEMEAMTEFYTSWGFALAVGIQGYFDFSGYCDMAIGLAILFNITIPVNFFSPYKSLDISDYWRRWHITMGRFLKYHVYIPMGGSRNGTLRTYWNIFFVFVLTGVWHGANWCCVLYGVLNGVLVGVNKLWKKTNVEIPKSIAILITFITMIFIAPLVMLKQINQYFIAVKSMLGIQGNFIPVTIENFNIVFRNSDLNLNVILFLGSLITIFGFKNSHELSEKYVKSDNLLYTIILAIIFVISSLSITRVSEFIYFNF